MEEARSDKQLSESDEEDYGAASLVKLEAAVEAMGAVAKLKTELDDRRSADVAEYQRTAQKLITHLEKKLEAAEQRVAVGGGPRHCRLPASRLAQLDY